MRLLVLLCVSAWSSFAFADPVPKESLIESVEAAYTKTAVIRSDSPFLDSILAPARSANPKAPADVWPDIKVEAATAIKTTFLEKGGLFDLAFRQAIENFSDDELQHLNVLLSDPVYAKMQSAMNNPASQRQLFQAMAGTTLRMTAALNAVLIKHGLNAVH